MEHAPQFQLTLVPQHGGYDPRRDGEDYIRPWIREVFNIDPHDFLSGALKVMAYIHTPPTRSHPARAIGQCEFWIIVREKMDHIPFDAQVCGISRGANWLQMQLFHVNGQFNATLWGEEPYKGTGVWDSEVDDCYIMFIEDLSVVPEFRNQGIGKRFLKDLRYIIHEQTSGRDLFVITLPDGDTPDDRGEAWRLSIHESLHPALVEKTIQSSRAGMIRLYRAAGFRRVGTSRWFAWISIPDHPSRALEANHDYDGPVLDRRLTFDLPIRVQEDAL
ncbi:Uu.00g129740.m01.CDS01 [Anthostomella pinea]|uniref:Uu.00g129740.m01.CDS01 n=1 Tax=Anthostomella pinea TaxID=933095 RepID=A0AAI8YI04_9PEZI|nr:Uu.00g129740.m01.CDS01 [Anthostomella pinea]